MWTWATTIVTKIDEIGTGSLDVMSALLATTWGQILLVVLGVVLLAFVLRIVFSIFAMTKGRG